MSDTPETDAALYPMNQVDIVWPEFARKLERERDEARENLEEEMKFHHRTHSELVAANCKILDLERELTNIYRWIERNHSDGFIDSLSYSQNLERVTDSWYDRLERVERERDEARGALMKIEDLFVDGTDIYADREKMGMIARNALEGAK